jgi:major type 1 subunit fimbrin (pilin)
MNKTLLSAALIAGFGMAAFAPQAAQASDGTININGAVTGSTCTVKINGAASPATITLPTVSTSALNAAGTTAGQTAFAINLTACTAAITKAATFFENGANVNAAGRLVNTGTTSATVDVQLLNNDNSVITVGSPAPSGGAGSFAVSSNAATLSYFARYYATAAAGAGSVASTVQFSRIYN